jgi:prevent-host-death family protein
MKVLNIQQAKTHLSRLIEQAMAGEEIVIAKAGRPCVRLIPCVPETSARALGGWEGRLWISPDFDAPDPAVIGLFESGSLTKQPRKQRRRTKR